MATATIKLNKRILSTGFGVPILVVLLLSMMVLPLPPQLLDLLFTFNISLSLVVLLAGIYSERPLDFSIFPTVLLLTTLLRLALNVASTRVVLLNGHTGIDAAGHVIESFGEVVIGGNFAVGFVVFIILMVINFVVVTKGAGRISEVSARFTLDAMPGKQMAIDADLNAGVITQEEAKVRREDVAREADFYGAMDGASKFVRGDAIAGIVILFVNLIGGLIIGVAEHDMALSEAFKRYSLLTIGDGLAAQVPSLILSIVAAIMVTRTSTKQNVGEEVLRQMFKRPKAILIAGVILAFLGLIPGMPHFPFLLISSLLIGVPIYSEQAQVKAKKTALIAASTKAVATPKREETKEKELMWEDVPPIDAIELQVGFRLVPLVDKKDGGDLVARIKGVRKKVSQQLGFLLPSVHIRDNLDLSPNTYRIMVSGVKVGEALVFPERDMAINPGNATTTLQGVETRDPAFGLRAVWIDKTQKDHAQAMGYTVVDASTVMATHLSNIMADNAYQLFGHEEAQNALTQLGKRVPKLVEDLTPKTVPLNTIVKVCQGLLYERIPVTDLRTIAESILDCGGKMTDAQQLLPLVRVALGKLIVQHILDEHEELPLVTLSQQLEQVLQQSVQSLAHLGGIEPTMVEKLQNTLKGYVEKQDILGQPTVLLVSPTLRAILARTFRNTLPNVAVLSYNEIPDTRRIRIIGQIGNEPS